MKFPLEIEDLPTHKIEHSNMRVTNLWNFIFVLQLAIWRTLPAANQEKIFQTFLIPKLCFELKKNWMSQALWCVWLAFVKTRDQSVLWIFWNWRGNEHFVPTFVINNIPINRSMNYEFLKRYSCSWYIQYITQYYFNFPLLLQTNNVDHTKVYIWLWWIFGSSIETLGSSIQVWFSNSRWQLLHLLRQNVKTLVFLAWNMSGDDTSPIFAECLLYLSYKLDNNKQPLSECPIKCCYWKLQLVIFNPFMGIAIILLICWYFRMTVMTPLFTIRTTSGYLYTSYSLLLYSICQDVFGLWWRGASWSSLARGQLTGISKITRKKEMS